MIFIQHCILRHYCLFATLLDFLSMFCFSSVLSYFASILYCFASLLFLFCFIVVLFCFIIVFVLLHCCFVLLQCCCFFCFGVVLFCFSVALFFFSVALFCFSVVLFCFSVVLFCFSVALFFFSVALFCFSVALFCFSVVLFCFSVVLFCFIVVLFCFSVILFCFSVVLFCFSVVLFCFSVVLFCFIVSTNVFYYIISLFFFQTNCVDGNFFLTCFYSGNAAIGFSSQLIREITLFPRQTGNPLNEWSISDEYGFYNYDIYSSKEKTLTAPIEGIYLLTANIILFSEANNNDIHIIYQDFTKHYLCRSQKQFTSNTIKTISLSCFSRLPRNTRLQLTVFSSNKVLVKIGSTIGVQFVGTLGTIPSFVLPLARGIPLMEARLDVDTENKNRFYYYNTLSGKNIIPHPPPPPPTTSRSI